MCNHVRFLPLESNPAVWQSTAQALGLADNWTFQDVWGLNPELLAFIPQPVKAVFLLYPITEKSEAKSESVDHSTNVYFTKQTIPNACGTIAMVHALLNNLDILKENSVLKKLYQTSHSATPEERAKFIEQSTDIANIHTESAQQGQTLAPSNEEEVDLHFICFVEHNGHLFELDGRKKGPINHGSISAGLLQDAANVIQTQFLDQDPESLNFTMMALASAS